MSNGHSEYVRYLGARKASKMIQWNRRNSGAGKASWAKSSFGFNLPELMIVILILGILIGIAIPVYLGHQAKTRDNRRLSDIQNVEAALEGYKFDHDVYPDSDLQGSGGWDTPGTPAASPDFIHVLVTEGYLDEDFVDPTTNDANGNYRYYRYAAESYDPWLPDEFYVLGIVDLEKCSGPHPDSPGWSMTGPVRDWQDEMEWVTGAYEDPFEG